MIKQVVILVGGKGTRLKNLTKNLPKPLIKINNLSFLELLLRKISQYYPQEIYLMAGFKAEKIKKKFHNKKILFSKVKVITENNPLGTGGCLSQLKNKINSNFLVLNGDSIFDIDILDFLKKSESFLKQNKALCSIALTKNINYLSNNKLSNLYLEKSKHVTFDQKNSGYMNAGIYLFNKKILDTLKKKYASLETQIIPKIIRKEQAGGFVFNNYFIDIGIKKNLQLFRSTIKKQFQNQKCLFLDRDGVINKLNGYVVKFSQMKMQKNIDSTLKYLNQKKILIIVITNQSAVGRGFINENDLNELHYKFFNKIFRKNGATINDIYYCPYIKNAKIKKYDKDSIYRKPKPGMLIKAIKDWGLQKKNCIFIGDQMTDQLAAAKANIKFSNINKENLFKKVKKLY